MKRIFERIIRMGGFNLNELIERINFYHANGSLTDEDREELLDAAREKADPTVDMDLLHKVEELATGLHAIERQVAILEQQIQDIIHGGTPDPSPDPTPEVEDFVEGKWYYRGDRVRWEGAVYTCAAPDGVVCVWPPSAYPAYWERELT